MKPAKKILLYGNSLILGTIGAGLKHCSGFEVESLKLPQEEPQALDASAADILAFDLDATPSEEVLSFLKTDSAKLLIGISPDSNLVRVWSAKELREVSMQDLLHVMLAEVREAPPEPVGHQVHAREALSIDH